jgi:hypothetical protein
MMKTNKRTWLRSATVAAFLAVALFGTTVKANTINVEFLSNAGGIYNYNANFENSELLVGDYFEVVDFAGFLNATAIAGFNITTPGTGPAPNSIIVNDDPTITNVVYTWAGAPGTEFELAVLPFTLTSSILTTVNESFASLDHVLVSGPTNGGLSVASGNLLVAGTPVPDGGSAIALLGMALMGVEGLRRKLMMS